MSTNPTQPQPGDALPEQATELTLEEISRSCAVQAGFIIELVEEGVIAPLVGQAPDSWRFTSLQLRHVAVASRLQRDLGVNLAGAALALQLLDEIETLRAHITASAAATDDD
ncbi:chaperone modulator CbpM [Rhodoferax sp. UBA5149]|uniref:chaperone modulator CbpM n=1 Tax=Rhodoferax sp. UBA5149 TaxID=1947379 RepID=UPI0025F5E9D5|nr:chaperone modulator CbpM [Rhodoferax sp. UBA5149]